MGKNILHFTCLNKNHNKSSYFFNYTVNDAEATVQYHVYEDCLDSSNK